MRTISYFSLIHIGPLPLLCGDTAHPTHDAVVYAVALLDNDNIGMEKRVFDVLHEVLSLQDIKNESKTYGIWPYFSEEPLEKMAPPDWNWADCIDTQLLQIAINHRERLPADLATRLDTALIHLHTYCDHEHACHPNGD